jgi:16S rRNA (cytosine1402-N4)-methyltransferase
MGGGIRKSDRGFSRGKSGPSRIADLSIHHSNYPHVPVLLKEAVQFLNLKPDCIYVDGTVGSGGHSMEILSRLPNGSRLICLDQDPNAIRLSEKRLSSDPRIRFAQSNFGDLSDVLRGMGISRINGVLLDLGMSSYQIEMSGRGFSFKRKEPLDMRMNPAHPTTAEDLIRDLSLESLQKLLSEFGEERRSKPLAKAIVRAREKEPVKTADRLAQIIEDATPRSHRAKRAASRDENIPGTPNCRK